MLTACGTPAEGVSPITEAWLAAMELDGSVRRQILGDVAGCLLAKPGTGKATRAQIEERNGMWLGLHTDHLKACVARAAKTNMPGVVLVATGHMEKAKVVLKCVREGLVTHLVIDQTCAGHLAKLLEIEKGVMVRRHKPEEGSECKFRTRQDLAGHLGLE
jgi:hypothetical protein